MKQKKLLILFVFIGLFFPAMAITDSLSTTYKNGEYISYCQLHTKASDSISNEVITRFVHQMCYDLDELFKWGLKDMSMADNKKGLLTFDFKKTVFNKKTSILKGIGDVIVPGVTTFPNIAIESKVTQKKYTSGRREVRLDLATPNPFIKSLVGVYSFIPKGRNKYGFYSLETHIQFGWFFNVFLTQKKYREIMEWRIKQLVRNMKEESEKRDKK
jgi:hypothetical protein